MCRHQQLQVLTSATRLQHLLKKNKRLSPKVHQQRAGSTGKPSKKKIIPGSCVKNILVCETEEEEE